MENMNTYAAFWELLWVNLIYLKHAKTKTKKQANTLQTFYIFNI